MAGAIEIIVETGEVEVEVKIGEAGSRTSPTSQISSRVSLARVGPEVPDITLLLQIAVVTAVLNTVIRLTFV